MLRFSLQNKGLQRRPGNYFPILGHTPIRSEKKKKLGREISLGLRTTHVAWQASWMSDLNSILNPSKNPAVTSE